MQIKVVFFWNFRNIQTATLIRKRIISALIDKARNSTEGNSPDPAKRYPRIGRVPGGAASIRRTGRGKKNPRGTRVRAANPPMPRALHARAGDDIAL